MPTYSHLQKDKTYIKIRKMDKAKMQEIISKFRMPDGEYAIIKHDEFGESEFYWEIEHVKSRKRFLLMNTYWHPGPEEEAKFYHENDYNVKKAILRKFETLEVPEDKDDPRRKYMYYDLYSIFEL